jgi:hypothetical protein
VIFYAKISVGITLRVDFLIIRSAEIIVT